MNYSIEGYSKYLQGVINRLNNFDETGVYIAAQTAHAEMTERIFTHGKASDGSSIGTYSAKPLYVNPNDAPRKFPPAGKYGQTEFNNGKPHKTGYFEGYQAYRSNQSRPANYVNLDLFGTLKSEWENSLHRTDNGWEADIEYLKNKQKVLGAQTRFGKTIFAASREEAETFTRILNLELNNLLNA